MRDSLVDKEAENEKRLRQSFLLSFVDLEMKGQQKKSKHHEDYLTQH